MINIKYVNEHGFTIIELIVIIVIIGILSVFVAPNFTTTGQMKLSLSARKLQSDLRYAQELAMTTNTNCGITFDTGENSYSVYENNDITDMARDPLYGSNFIVDFDDLKQFSGITISSVNLGGAGVIEFDKLGRPFMVDGSTPISSPNNVITLSYSGETKIITITGNTGSIVIN